MERWQNRVALVTGASSGIGAAIAADLASAGMKVVACARRIERIEQLRRDSPSDSGNIRPYKCDLTNPEEVSEMFAWIESQPDLGHVDVCINNAGTNFSSSLMEGTTDQWQTMSSLHLVSLCQCTQLTAKSIIKDKVPDGHVIFISSVFGRQEPLKSKGHSHFYSATKHAVQSLMESWRLEFKALKSSGGPSIKSSVLSPGLVDTEITSKTLGMGPQEARDLLERLQVDLLSPGDVACSVRQILQAPVNVHVQDMVVRSTHELI